MPWPGTSPGSGEGTKGQFLPAATSQAWVPSSQLFHLSPLRTDLLAPSSGMVTWPPACTHTRARRSPLVSSSSRRSSSGHSLSGPWSGHPSSPCSPAPLTVPSVQSGTHRGSRASSKRRPKPLVFYQRLAYGVVAQFPAPDPALSLRFCAHTAAKTCEFMTWADLSSLFPAAAM